MSDWGRLGAVPLLVGFGPEPGVGASVRVAVDSNYITHSVRQDIILMEKY